MKSLEERKKERAHRAKVNGGQVYDHKMLTGVDAPNGDNSDKSNQKSTKTEDNDKDGYDGRYGTTNAEITDYITKRGGTVEGTPRKAELIEMAEKLPANPAAASGPGWGNGGGNPA